MELKNTREEFGLVARVFHWAVGVLVLILLSVGFLMTGLAFSPVKLTIYMLHKSFGITVLILMIGRVLWRGISPRPDALPTHAKWEDILAKIVHFGLYVCLFVMPLSGWLMSSAGGFPATFFGLFSLPVLVAKSEPLFELTRNFHTYTAYTILWLLALHFGGAFKHHFIDRDITLKRMTSMKVDFWWGLMFVAVAGLFWTSPFVIQILKGPDEKLEEVVQTRQQTNSVPVANIQGNAVPSEPNAGWIIDLTNSSIDFTATQYGEVFEGSFKNFGGKIIFDPANLEDAYADIWIDIGSISTGSEDRDGQAKSAEWFDSATYPRAMFVADSFSETVPGQYVAHGALTIRGRPMAVEFPFTLDIRESPKGQAALMDGEISLNRLDFGIGQGQWSSPDTIGNAVAINVRVLATEE